MQDRQISHDRDDRTEQTQEGDRRHRKNLDAPEPEGVGQHAPDEREVAVPCHVLCSQRLRRQTLDHECQGKQDPAARDQLPRRRDQGTCGLSPSFRKDNARCHDHCPAERGQHTQQVESGRGLEYQKRHSADTGHASHDSARGGCLPQEPNSEDRDEQRAVGGEKLSGGQVGRAPDHRGTRCGSSEEESIAKHLVKIAKCLANVYAGAVTDQVQTILDQWARERPDLDVSPMAVLGRLSRVAHLVHARQEETFARHGLDAASFDVLATLRRSGKPYRLTPTDIQRSEMVTSSAIAQRLNRLERSGLVVRSRNSEDARATDVTLTEEGRSLIDRALPDHVDTEHALLRGLTSAQRTQLSVILTQLYASVGEQDPAGTASRATRS
jgi:DNA-binding MarR family transcriptional regulator